MKTALTFLTVLFLFAASNGQSLEGKFQKIIDSIYNSNPESNSIMVHVESPKYNVSWSGAAGYSDRSIKMKIEPDQPALIASCTKTYVSATILRLVEEKVIEINQPIKDLVSNKTRMLFESDGYDLDSITLMHLLSHTSGIEDYANQEYRERIINYPKHRWTRDEQIEMAIKVGNPIAKPGKIFRYANVNYLLLTEIIEKLTGKPFYTAIRELLRFETLGFNTTWFPTLEEKPKGTKALVHQYWGEYSSFRFDVSIDLYGAGGLACTTKDLACFSHNLFNAKIIKDTTVLNLIFTKIQTNDSIQSNYYLGLMSDEYRGFKAYWHKGFWGNYVLYFPDLNTSISVFILQTDKKIIGRNVIDQIIGILIDKKNNKIFSF
ncbi:MAG: serine hydrolase domain-containing protein [Bacteroidales bacterium]|nr:serine hydrolase domain-containing protein [Bacteroidales bacterium]